MAWSWGTTSGGSTLAPIPDIVGRAVVLGGRSLVVAGVMPRGFRGLAPPGVKLDFWMPIDLRAEGGMLRNRGRRPSSRSSVVLRPGYRP